MVKRIKEGNYKYKTSHGLQPGTTPKGIKIDDIEDTNKYTYFSTDRELSRDELDYFDIQHGEEPSWCLYPATLNMSDLRYNTNGKDYDDVIMSIQDLVLMGKPETDRKSKWFYYENDAFAQFNRLASRPYKPHNGKVTIPVLIKYYDNGEHDIIDYGDIDTSSM